MVKSGTHANALYEANALKYRGYYYDKDLGMYYLKTRYYDPEICRFVNADGYMSTGQGLSGYNMYSYCANNPVNGVDPEGKIFTEIADFFKDPVNNAKIFERNEDFQNGEHYHAMMIEWDGKHDKKHYEPGTKVPEPWNTIYFGR